MKLQKLKNIFSKDITICFLIIGAILIIGCGLSAIVGNTEKPLVETVATTTTYSSPTTGSITTTTPVVTEIVTSSMVITGSHFLTGTIDTIATSPIETVTSTPITTEPPVTTSTPIEIEVPKIEKVKVNSISEAEELKEYAAGRLEVAEGLLASAEDLGLAQDHPVVVYAQAEIDQCNEVIQYYNELIQELEIAYWMNKEEEYPIATEIWRYMKEQGWNDYVCAGIMGNIMAECGGQTLNIQYWLYDKSGDFYGICQWYNRYFPDVQGTNLPTQLDFLKDTIKSQLDSWGDNYKNGFNYEKFLQLTNAKDAALAFAKCYERCSPQHYAVRENNAIVAYRYFTEGR